MRAFALLVTHNGVMKAYFYRDVYFRTSSKPFSLDTTSRNVHLTNDAVQQFADDYGKYENANKLSINDFQRFLSQNFEAQSVSFVRDLLPRMERLVTDSVRAVALKIDPLRKHNSFEIFGYDFMIESDFQVKLIECNTNPSLEVCSPLLARIVPELLDNSFRIALDPLFQPACLQIMSEDDRKRKKLDQVQQLKYTLIYDDLADLEELKKFHEKDFDNNF